MKATDRDITISVLVTFTKLVVCRYKTGYPQRSIPPLIPSICQLAGFCTLRIFRDPTSKYFLVFPKPFMGTTWLYNTLGTWSIIRVTQSTLKPPEVFLLCSDQEDAGGMSMIPFQNLVNRTKSVFSINTQIKIQLFNCLLLIGTKNRFHLLQREALFVVL